MYLSLPTSDPVLTNSGNGNVIASAGVTLCPRRPRSRVTGMRDIRYPELSDGFGDAPTSFDFNITTQISWAITALLIRPVREEATWVCLGGVPDFDKPRILLNFLIQYKGNPAFRQIDAQKPVGMDRNVYLDSVATYLWSLIKTRFMAMIDARMRRNPRFRAKVERARGGEGCGRVPFDRRGGDVAV